MGISLSTLTEGCCDKLNSLTTVNLDEYKEDKSSSSIDRLLECNDKYILIEEKSFLLDYFRLASQEAKVKFLPINGNIENSFLDAIKELPRDIKEKTMYKSFSEKTLSSADKIKDTIIMLCQDEQFCNDKIKKSEIIYLYCNSNNLHVDKLLNIIFNSKKTKQKIVECTKLDKYLKLKQCS